MSQINYIYTDPTNPEACKIRELLFLYYPNQYKQILGIKTKEDLTHIYTTNAKVHKITNWLIENASGILDELIYSLNQMATKKIKKKKINTHHIKKIRK